MIAEQRDRVPGPAQGGVDGDRPRLPQCRGGQLAHPVEQHGNVSGASGSHRAPSSRVIPGPPRPGLWPAQRQIACVPGQVAIRACLPVVAWRRGSDVSR